MIRISLTPFLLISLVTLCGVAAPPTKPAESAATKPAGAGGIENPQYKAWANFKPETIIHAHGSSIRKVEQEGEKLEIKTEVQIEQTLLQLTPEKAVIYSSTKTTQDGNPKPMQLRKITIPRFVAKEELDELGKGFDPELLRGAAEETVTVPAGTFKTKVVQFEKKQGKTTVKIKAWFSFDVPGGAVKQEQESEGGGKTTIELISIDKK